MDSLQAFLHILSHMGGLAMLRTPWLNQVDRLGLASCHTAKGKPAGARRQPWPRAPPPPPSAPPATTAGSSLPQAGGSKPHSFHGGNPSNLPSSVSGCSVPRQADPGGPWPSSRAR